MNHQTLSIVFMSAIAMSVPWAGAADLTPVEAADRQFLANLEQAEGGKSPATPTIEVVKPAPVAEGPAAKKGVKETPARVATTAKKPSFRASQAPARVEVVEIRRAVPVTTTAVTTRRDRHEDDDHDPSDGFFNRLFRGDR